MSVTPSKLYVGFIGLLISVYLFPGLGGAEQTAETEADVVLEEGTGGILPCRIRTKANLIQWKRQLASEHLLVYQDLYCNDSARAGSGYHPKMVDITDDYSLIIKDVKVQDEGLYICEVSDFQTGEVFRNRTRVSVQGMEPHVILEMGARGILSCPNRRQVHTVNMVRWERQVTSETELLLSLDPNGGANDGPGYEADLFSITEDYSLVIKDVKVQDEGLYICTFFDYKTRKVFRSSTRVSVQALPDEPFPTIQECIGKDEKSGVCYLTVYLTPNLTCLVEGYYPDIDLFFLHGSEKVTSTEHEEWNNTDGTKSKNIRIQISVSDQPYQCVVPRMPGLVGNRAVSVIVQARPPAGPPARPQGLSANAVVFPVLICVGICLSIAAFFKYHRGNYKAVDSERIISRKRWGARKPKAPREWMDMPVSYVILLNTAGIACRTFEECCKEMRRLQNFHMDSQRWNDIGYSFVVGNDGRVYECRGWNAVGAHTIEYNRKSIGIGVMGTCYTELPIPESLDALKYIMDLGVTKKVLTEDYILLGQRQASPGRPYPGDALYKEIQSWPQWREGNFFEEEGPRSNDVDNSTVLRRSNVTNLSDSPVYAL